MSNSPLEETGMSYYTPLSLLSRHSTFCGLHVYTLKSVSYVRINTNVTGALIGDFG